MKNFSLNKRTFVLTFGFLVIVNLALAAFLIKSVWAQTPNKYRNQPPVITEVFPQEDSPLMITAVNVDNLGSFFQNINFALKNTGNKPIRAYVVVANGKTSGKILTNSMMTKPLKRHDVAQHALPVERENITEGEIVSLSIDYVEFVDGSSWGQNSQQLTDMISGERSGRIKAIEHLRKLISENDSVNLDTLLTQHVSTLVVQLPENEKSDKWQRGYQRGFKSVISLIQRHQSDGIEAISAKIDEIERFAK